MREREERKNRVAYLVGEWEVWEITKVFYLEVKEASNDGNLLSGEVSSKMWLFSVLSLLTKYK